MAEEPRNSRQMTGSFCPLRRDTPMKPEVTFVTCCFNSSRFLRATIDSGLVALSGIPFEWLFVDDGSTDGTASIVESYRNPSFRVIRNRANEGIHASMKTGVLAASGSRVVIVDHDDVVPPGSVAARIGALDEEGVAAVFGAVTYIDVQSRPYRTIRLARKPIRLSGLKGLLRLFASPTWPLKQGGVMFRRAQWNPECGFDIRLLLSMTRDYRVAFVPDVTLLYRTFQGQRSGLRSRRLRYLYRLVWARLAFRFLPWYLAVPVSIYKTGLEIGKVVWVLFSDRK